MRLTDYEAAARREIEAWQRERSPLPYQLFSWAMAPIDWIVDGFAPPDTVDRVSEGLEHVLARLNDLSAWTVTESEILRRARSFGLETASFAELRRQPLEKLDPLARASFAGSTVLAAIEGGGTGLGGAAFIAADIPLLFGINFRLIQQVGGSYGLPVRGATYSPLVLAIFNVAASDSGQAKSDALREASVAAAAFAHGLPYRGRTLSGTLREQNRQVPREIAKQIAAHKLGQLIPVAGAAVGAGVNYWFTTRTARAAYMVFRAIAIERKERS